MNEFIKHYVGKMDKDTRIQRCLVCGEIFLDYSHAAWPDDQPPPKGFEPGYVFVRAGNPTYYTIELPKGAEFKYCI